MRVLGVIWFVAKVLRALFIAGSLVLELLGVVMHCCDKDRVVSGVVQI